MTGDRIGVGIIGVNPNRGWARTAHIPALRSLPAYDIRALSASNRESADRAGSTFGVAATFADHNELVARPEVDLVVVTVKVPHHRELVTAALNAGKAVLRMASGYRSRGRPRHGEPRGSETCLHSSGCRHARHRPSSMSAT